MRKSFLFYWWDTPSFPLIGVLVFKRLYKKTNITCLDDIVRVVERSASVNNAQLVGDLDGNTMVQFFDLSTFFEEHTTKTALKGITQMQHFRFHADSPGYVFVKECSDGKERKIKLVKDTSWRPNVAELPATLTSLGLTLEREWYLYNKIREFCPDNTKDIVCPLPKCPLE